MFASRRTPQRTIVRIYKYIQNGAGVSTVMETVSDGKIFFAVPRHRPTRWLKLMLWHGWGLLEIYAPGLLNRLRRLLLRICRRTSLEPIMESLLTEQDLNGNLAAPEAIARGAQVAIVDSRYYRGGDSIYVPNTNAALYQTARYHRDQFEVDCIGVTGSCGKTTTKELIAAVVSAQRSTVATAGNSNTMQGVSHTVFNISQDTQAAVIEIASTGGDTVAEQCKIARPNIGIITNIGKAHLLGFGNIDGVARVKRQLYDFIAANGGMFFANIDDPFIVDMIEESEKTWTYGEHATAKTQGFALSCDPFLCVRCSLKEYQSASSENDWIDIKTQLFGKYNLHNVLATVAVARHLGISFEAIRDAIESYYPSNHRSQIITCNDVTYIVDAYNANPTSMNAALSSFAEYRAVKKGVILGDMLELGDSSESEHRAVLERLVGMNLGAVILVGREFSKYADPGESQCFFSVRELTDWLATQDLCGMTLLLKGSQSVGLEALVAQLSGRA